MDANRGENIRIGRAHNDRHTCARRHAGNIHAVGIDGPLSGVLLDGLHNTGNDRRLAAAPRLVGGQEPVPAFAGVGTAGLLRIDNNKLLLIRQRVHLRTGGKIRGVLCTAMQHHDKRSDGTHLIADRSVNKVGTTASRTIEGELLERAAAGVSSDGTRYKDEETAYKGKQAYQNQKEFDATLHHGVPPGEDIPSPLLLQWYKGKPPTLSCIIT